MGRLLETTSVPGAGGRVPADKKEECYNRGMTQVRDFWKPQNGHQDFRTWTDKEWWERMEPTAEIDKLLEALDKRRIRTHTGEDKL